MIQTLETPHPSSDGNNRSKARQPNSDEDEAIMICPLCGNHDLQRLFEAVDTLHGFPGTRGIVKCRGCGLMSTSPRPGPEKIIDFYPDDYQPFSAPHARPAASWKRAVKPVVGRLFDTKEHVLPRRVSGGTALEVGCGSGRFLMQLAEMGWKAQAIDPSAATITELRQRTDLPLEIGTIQSATFESESFDLIAALMVLEHLHDPVGDARKLCGWLRHGGWLTGSVLNCASWEFRFFGADWYALQVPTHLSHFTPTTLRILLEKAGFGNVKIFQQRNVSNLMVHLGRVLARHHLPFSSTLLDFPERGPRVLRYAVRPAASILAWLRQGGRISFLAQKVGP